MSVLVRGGSVEVLEIGDKIKLDTKALKRHWIECKQ
jgi:hypothetical protein